MAGIEKICEVSGNYPDEPSDMYAYKHNHIQVLPEYRKMFKGRDAKLVFFEHKSIDTTYVFSNNRLIEKKTYWYCLIVPSIEGRVNGCYFNHFTQGNKNTVIRRMRRLVGGTLTIENLPITLYEYQKSKLTK